MLCQISLWASQPISIPLFAPPAQQKLCMSLNFLSSTLWFFEPKPWLQALWSILVFQRTGTLLLLKSNVVERPSLQPVILSFCTKSCLGFSRRAWVLGLIKIKQNHPHPALLFTWLSPRNRNGCGHSHRVLHSWRTCKSHALGSMPQLRKIIHTCLLKENSIDAWGHSWHLISEFIENWSLTTGLGNWQFCKVHGIGWQGPLHVSHGFPLIRFLTLHAELRYSCIYSSKY